MPRSEVLRERGPGVAQRQEQQRQAGRSASCHDSRNDPARRWSRSCFCCRDRRRGTRSSHRWSCPADIRSCAIRNNISLPIGWMAGSGVAALTAAPRSPTSAATTSFRIRVRHCASASTRRWAGSGDPSRRQVTEFAQVLVGVVRGSGTAFSFHEHHKCARRPAGFVDYPLSQRLAGRASSTCVHPESAGRQRSRSRISLRRRDHLPFHAADARANRP